MLSNAYFLAKFRFDTAENEPAKNLQNFANFADPNPLTLTGQRHAVAAARRRAGFVEPPVQHGALHRHALHADADQLDP